MALQWPHPEDPDFELWIYEHAPEIQPKEMAQQSERAILAYMRRWSKENAASHPWATDDVKHRICAVLNEAIFRGVSPEDRRQIEQQNKKDEDWIEEQLRREFGEDNDTSNDTSSDKT